MEYCISCGVLSVCLLASKCEFFPFVRKIWDWYICELAGHAKQQLLVASSRTKETICVRMRGVHKVYVAAT